MTSWYERNKERHAASTKRSYEATRQGVLDAYGGRCACCAEDTPEFLALDHIRNDGAKQRRAGRLTGYTFYRQLKKAGYPKDDYQLLCHNCNHAKTYGRTCPHLTGKLSNAA